MVDSPVTEPPADRVDLAERFARDVRALDLVGARCVVAVSGGADSVCLAHLVYRTMRTLRLEPIIGHVDHGLRAAAAADARAVAGLAERLGIAATVRRVDVAGSERRRLGLEAAARDARYAALAAIAGEHGARAILTAHTRDDNVETIMLRIIRGTGTLGLGGIEASTTLGADPAPRVVRPLLGFRGWETREYCVAQNLVWREDESNADTSLVRNRVRHHLLPLLRTYNPAIDDVLLRLAMAARAENEWMEVATARRARVAVTTTPHGVRVALSRTPRALRNRLVRRGLERALGRTADVGDAVVDRLVVAAASRRGATVRLPGNVVAQAGAGAVLIPLIASGEVQA